MEPVVFRLTGAAGASKLEASVTAFCPELDLDQNCLVLPCKVSTEVALGTGSQAIVYQGLVPAMTVTGSMIVTCGRTGFVLPIEPVTLDKAARFSLSIPLFDKTAGAWYASCTVGNFDVVLDLQASLSAAGQPSGKVSLLSGLGCVTLTEPQWLPLRERIMASRPTPGAPSRTLWGNLAVLATGAAKHLRQGYLDASLAESRTILATIMKEMSVPKPEAGNQGIKIPSFSVYVM